MAERGAAIGAYVVSFVAMLARSDGWLLLLNLIVLLAITFMPYPTAVLADRLVTGQQVNLAVAFYGIGQLLPALAMCVLFQYCRSAALLAPAVDGTLLRSLTWLTWGSVIAYVVSIAVALVAPGLSLIYYALSPVYWAIDGARARHELPKPHRVKR